MTINDYYLENEIESPKSRVEVLLSELFNNSGSLLFINVELPKDTYEKNEIINYKDAVVTAKFDSGRTIRIPSNKITWLPDNNSILNTSGYQNIVASYTNKNITKTWKGKVFVLYPISRIEVTTPPVKTEYNEGDTIDFTGIKVTAYRENDDIWGVVPFNELDFPVTIVSID